MGNPYTEPSISGYNSNPPPDDGSTGTDNIAEWGDIKDKFGDPLKTLVETNIANLTTAFGKIVGGAGVTSYATSSTVQTSDQGKIVRASASGITITTPDATSVGSPFVFCVVNDGGGNITLDGNGSQTINGESSYTMIDQSGAMLYTDGSNWFAIGLNLSAGKQTVWVPAAAMQPTTSNGCASLATVETTAGRPDLHVLDFDASSDEHAQFEVAFPKSWNGGTVTYQAYWTSTATDTDGVTWSLQGVACADGDTIDVAYGSAITVEDANQSTAEDLYVTDESAAVTIAGSPGDAELTFFRVFRDVSDANDTASEDARLIGIKLFFTTDAGNDA